MQKTCFGIFNPGPNPLSRTFDLSNGPPTRRGRGAPIGTSTTDCDTYTDGGNMLAKVKAEKKVKNKSYKGEATRKCFEALFRS